jgi:hypothetical protein
MRPRKLILPQAGTGGYGIRPYFFCSGRSPPPQRAAPRVELSPFVESEIRRGAFYMRPRRFALPQADTGGYGIRPYIFCGGRSPFAEAVPRVELSPFVESEIRRGAFYMRPRKFALLQADTGGYGIRPYVFLWRAEAPRRGRRPAWSCLPLLKTRSVGAHSICARGGLSYRKRARTDMESAPTFFCRGGEGRVFACCACKRIYFRLRLVKNHLMWYTISLQVHRQTRCKPATQSYRGPSGQPVANKKLLFYCRR